MRPGQWKGSCVVVERSRSPSGDWMAGGALRSSRWKTRSHVIWHISADGGGALESSRMAAIAVRRIQRVVAVDMACSARCRKVRTHQRETRGAVVECASGPGGNGMAGGTLRGRRREARSHVIWYISTDGSGALECSRVAAIAVRGIQRVVVVRMAGSARRRKVRAHQRKPGDAVIERRCVPTCRGVAVGAIPHRKSCTRRRMHRIVRSLPGGQMAL